jgi:hypothetical protein
LVLPDGRVLSWSEDRTIRRWNVDHHLAEEAFYFDAIPIAVLPLNTGVVFVGDALGRVHVLDLVVSRASTAGAMRT